MRAAHATSTRVTYHSEADDEYAVDGLEQSKAPTEESEQAKDDENDHTDVEDSWDGRWLGSEHTRTLCRRQ